MVQAALIPDLHLVLEAAQVFTDPANSWLVPTVSLGLGRFWGDHFMFSGPKDKTQMEVPGGPLAWLKWISPIHSRGCPPFCQRIPNDFLGTAPNFVVGKPSKRTSTVYPGPV